MSRNESLPEVHPSVASLSNPIGSRPQTTRALQGFDFALFMSAFILVVFGLMTIYSEASGRQDPKNFERQLVNTMIGLVPGLVMYFVNPKFWQRVSWGLYGAMVSLLFVTLFLGKVVKGSQRWIDVGPLQFQPSEAAKLLCILTMASFFANRELDIKKPLVFLLGLLHIALPMFLTFKQPHLGATMVLFVAWLAISFVAGTPLKFYGILFAGLLALGIVAWKVPAVKDKLFQGYQLERVQGLLSKKKDRRGDNYQTDRAEIAFGVGGVTGSGYNRGVQKAKGFVPEQRNDFIFTVVGEEGGLVGCSVVLAAFGFFFFRIFLVMTDAEDIYFRMIAAGVFAILGFQMFVNLGMLLQIVPVVGLWLPFMSSGGTAIWLCLGCVGLLLSIRQRERRILY
jgi:rod shape determining protein RodA